MKVQMLYLNCYYLFLYCYTHEGLSWILYIMFKLFSNNSLIYIWWISGEKFKLCEKVRNPFWTVGSPLDGSNQICPFTHITWLFYRAASTFGGFRSSRLQHSKNSTGYSQICSTSSRCFRHRPIVLPLLPAPVSSPDAAASLQTAASVPCSTVGSPNSFSTDANRHK